ncbi:acyl-CoA dehydratase activase [Leptogranulimonas caecicola]|uniref:Bifunctional 2-hydroxyacyl-CoA dehydratase/activator domain-containing protein n=1 Tax=Leptogranulimonas caecicola TaxID=2894156 RepID=A0AAU9CQ25_9ACTN|nr:acyl-CoA dehydratase activase [Leptogranulimonas caecicola]BCV19371.1 bifunctional 2-hydroxyacyl-CoA dehydratase/activator domain-containing protein [Atopobiaceae bacterium P1]BDC91756.1 bifunctional 2-hydroxyacyl-CoA dehydratase/activator domain-containing protein [Leptogranulimonas caecicola]
MTPTVYYPCKYAPIELLAGYGAACKPVTYEATSFEDADRLAHPNLCGFGKSLIAFALKPEVKALVLTSCCDVMRRVYDVLDAEQCLDFLFMVDLPHLTGPAERARLASELERLTEAWERYSGEAFDVGAALSSFEPPVARQDARVTLLGAHGPESLLKAAESAFDLPVENLTCTGGRRVASPPASLGRAIREEACRENCDASTPAPDPKEAFIGWYAGALLDQTPCLRMADISGRQNLIGTPGQRGVIYHTMKFCDYYGFEYLMASQDAVVPMIKVETDGTRQSAGQLSTRLKAFDETLVGMTDTLKFDKGTGPIYVLGVDSGSTSTDAVIVDKDGTPVATVILPTGAKATESAQRAIDSVLEKAGLTRDQITLAVATGYGRDSIPTMDTSITEITCHARGAHALCPEAMTIVDIGGQDSKVIKLDEDGNVVNFVMNDKCAAGTGRFLEMMARTMELPLDEFCTQGLSWKHDVKISSMCTVFAESEVVSLVADDTPVPDIIHGLDRSVASKITSLAKRVKAEPPYLMTGGVANNEGVVTAIGEALGAPVATSEDSQLCGALGAALLGLEALV